MRVSFEVCRRRLSVALIGLFTIGGLAVSGAPASAATLTVCASGCAYSDLQLALNASQPGDTILLRAGETFVGNFELPAKSTDGPPILIRSDAPDSAFPAAGTRLVPPGYPGANVAAGTLARLKGVGGGWKNNPVIMTQARAHNYRFQFLDIDGIAQEGWGTLVELGNNSDLQTTLDVIPYGIVFDRVFVHGHPIKGQKRCIALNGSALEVLNSYISGCAASEIDAQAIAGFNGPGPFRIINNFLEASTENILFGGADPRIPNLVPSDIEIKRNFFSKPVAWRNPILSTPSAAPAVTSIASGGALAAGTHYFTVVAILNTAGDDAWSAQSPEATVSVASNSSAVTLSWPSVSNAESYRIYHGTSRGGENRYMTTAGAVTSFKYTGSAEISGTPPAQAKLWNVKNLLELKNAQRVAIDGNVFEHSWAASQKGYAILLTPRNQDGAASWVAVRDISITNNIIRHVSGAIDILGDDYDHPSQRTSRVLIRNNLVYDVSSTWGGEHFLLITRSPVDVTVDHNTISQEQMIVLVDDGASTGFTFTNNSAPHNEYGIFGSGAGIGNALTVYFPNSVVRRNAFGGGPASLYPADNLFPDMATFNAQFVNRAGEDFRLVSGSIFKGVATDGKDIGVDFAALDAAMKGSGGDTGGSTGGGSTGGGSTGSGTPVPFNGTPAPLPGTVQAENFDAGGSEVAYHDATAGNSGGQYRATDVDVEDTSDSGGGHDVGWVSAGEWLKYTVSVAAAGTYDLDVRVASAGAGGTFHVEANGVDLTGRLTVPNTGGWQTWTTLRKSVTLAAGQQVWRVVMDTNGATAAVGNFNYLRLSARAGSAAYGGTATALPGTLQAENFDEGGAGVAYADSSSGNSGGQFRNTDVDIESSSDSGGGYNLGWVAGGEWLNYSVTVGAAGTYDIDVRVASAGSGGTFHLEVNGVDKTGRLTVPNTGGWQTWTNVRKTGVTLAAGPQVWRLVMDTNGATSAVGNFNYLRATAASTSTSTTAYGGTPVSLPGVIQVENFDEGGQSRGYSDTTTGNAGGKYRSTDVDIEQTSDSGGGYNVGWAAAGEWLNYSVNVTAAGTYDVDVRVASAGSGGSFHLELNGSNLGSLVVPNTGGWQTWTTIRKTVVLPAGPQTLRLGLDSNGATGAVGNFNFITVSGPR